MALKIAWKDIRDFFRSPSLEGLSLKAALQRTIQFAWPTFWVSATLSLISLGLRGISQSVLVGAFSGLLSLTLIKLFSYLLLIVFGTSLALSSIASVSRLLRWLAKHMSAVTFDCVSTSLGVMVGITPALVIDRSVTYAASWLVWVLVIFVFIQLLLWGASNSNEARAYLGRDIAKATSSAWDLLISHALKCGISRDRIAGRFRVLAGVLIILVGVILMWNDGWKGVSTEKSLNKAAAQSASWCQVACREDA